MTYVYHVGTELNTCKVSSYHAMENCELCQLLLFPTAVSIYIFLHSHAIQDFLWLLLSNQYSCTYMAIVHLIHCTGKCGSQSLGNTVSNTGWQLKTEAAGAVCLLGLSTTTLAHLAVLHLPHTWHDVTHRLQYITAAAKF